ncbi:RagB/SusD family nutrient uptake outer membrane protein [Sinomicrobium weinanense]|uniref:RagB/SusD family nutrient uptake outer membrane protein n=1 Tax=Sinomicrobium weinanense TaxID=2842200 RepID=A0A926JUA0_9FLAO|nr:RagB/SusD family nutrient uptake outer membrane protein [Sinomicrobium weinanense]MBC9797316.1 RagB/SusD family nutrient uptake outer membrane protein [Sinomicrobium weinanense]MBU3122785.1 RagB/SusD family nutrient uptake outer membrane protein [Sinomicrobium weinanense]
MKNNILDKIRLALAGIAVIFLASCDVTDLSPADIVPDEEAYSTAERIESAVLGVYEAAQAGYYNGVVDRGYPFGAASTEQGDMRGEDMYNDQLFYEATYTAGYTPNTLNNNGMWISLYRLINRSNLVIENLDGAVENGVIDQATRDRYRGEMLFIRALSHHELLIHFSRPYSDDPSSLGIPYRTFAIDEVGKVEEGQAVGRSTVGEDYGQLLTDLDEAEELLSDIGTTPYRAGKGAAIALKTRIKLHQGDWEGVLAEYDKIAGDYAVTTNLLAPYESESTDNIFGFQHSAQSNPGTNGTLSRMYGNPDNGGRGLVKISPVIWRADFWLEDDLRRDITSNNNVGIYTGKYMNQVTQDDNIPTIRFAEVLLNAAEANARLNKLDDGVDLLNTVRDRALPEGTPSYTSGGLGGQNEVLQAVWNERRIEFLAEGRRWPDIHRLSGEGLMEGVPLKATSRSVTSLDFYTGKEEVALDHAIPYSDYRFIWPVPLSEIQNNTTAPIEQNPGY